MVVAKTVNVVVVVVVDFDVVVVGAALLVAEFLSVF